MCSFSIIGACSSMSRGIGFKNKLSWPQCKEDMDFFRQMTTTTKDLLKRNAVIMGKNTFESLNMPDGLKKRLNIVLSRKQKEEKIGENVIFCKSLDKALEMLQNRSDIETIFVIGGQQVYETAIHHKNCDKIYLNLIRVRDSLFDTFFPEVNEDIYEKESESFLSNDVTSIVYRRKIIK
jgi:dihydrofolate reductase